MEQSQRYQRASRIRKFWTPYTDEELSLSCAEGNVYDKHAIVVHNADAVVVGRAPRKMSRVFWFLLQHSDTGKCFLAPWQQFHT